VTDVVSVSSVAALGTATRALIGCGTPDDLAALVAAQLVESDKAGHASHGIARVPWYVRYVRDSVLVPDRRPTVLGERPCLPSVIAVSGEWGFGQPAALTATQLAVEKAHEFGISVASVVRCTHVGRLGHYVEIAARAGCVAFATVGGMRGGGVAVPYAGSDPLLGPVPVAAAFPTWDDDPVLMDFSTTEVPLGKVMDARQHGQRLATDGLVEADGTPTDDPEALDRGGALRTWGGHKGFALATIAELVGSALTGTWLHAEEGLGGASFRSAGMTLVVVSAGAFTGADDVRREASRLREEIRAVRPAPGFARVLAPGDPEAEARLARRESFTVPRSVWDEICRLAATPHTECA